MSSGLPHRGQPAPFHQMWLIPTILIICLSLIMALRSISAVKTPAISGAADASLIFMHGLGDTGEGWSFFSQYVQRSPVVKSAPNINFVFPNAPNAPVTANGGMLMPSWFDILVFGGRGDKADHEGFFASCNAMKEFIQKEMTEKNIPAERIIIGGFSQGSAIAMGTLALLDFKIGGCVALSGFLPVPEKLLELFKKEKFANADTPVFQGHGTSDPIIPFSYAQETHEFYKNLGFKNWCFKSYPGLAHSASEDELADVLKYISSVLD